MSYHVDKLGDGRTDAGNDNTRRPKLASGNKTTFNMHCLTQWISKLYGSCEIHWVRQYAVMGLAGIANATVYNTKPIFADLSA